jgi:hypothetical protein
MRSLFCQRIDDGSRFRAVQKHFGYEEKPKIGGGGTGTPLEIDILQDTYKKATTKTEVLRAVADFAANNFYKNFPAGNNGGEHPDTGWKFSYGKDSLRNNLIQDIRQIMPSITSEDLQTIFDNPADLDTVIAKHSPPVENGDHRPILGIPPPLPTTTINIQPAPKDPEIAANIIISRLSMIPHNMTDQDTVDVINNHITRELPTDPEARKTCLHLLESKLTTIYTSDREKMNTALIKAMNNIRAEEELVPLSPINNNPRSYNPLFD